MIVAVGARLGSYEITAKLGEGGMGEVWRATDTKLKRDVAIKVLPRGFTEDKERLARFEREAQLLAQLQHPNIASIYGMEESTDGARALVMELVEGPTLAERLEAGPLSFDESLSVCVQIAHALEEAHEKGIVHRDLKPQNIKTSIEGKTKVLDFGLAKAMDPVAGSRAAAEFANSPTLTFGGTREGVILGTAAYMAPEQARGAAVDARADLWAFGVILYEMLTGERLFAEQSVVDTLSAVMRKSIDLGRLPVTTPARLRELLRRMLERQPDERLHHAADARIVLAELVREGPAAWEAEARIAAPAGALPNRSRWIAAALGGLAIGLFVAWAWFGRAGSTVAGARGGSQRGEVRFQISPAPGTEFGSNVENLYLAVSPDGSTLAYIGFESSAPARVWLRRVDELEARPLAGTEGARSIAWSPDGRSIAFFVGASLKRLELAGGSAVPICEAPPGTGLAASWGTAGEILFASVQGEAIYRVAAAGGVPEKVVTPDESQGDFRVAWPTYLPDGRAFLFLARTIDRKSKLMLVEPGSPPRAVAPLDSRVELVAPDLLVFARDGALLAQRLDRAGAKLVGAPLSIAPAVRYFYSSAWAGFTTSPGGTLFYLTEPSASRLIWFDRSGRRDGELGPEGSYQNLSLSPDGRTVLADRMRSDLGTHDIWQIDVERGVETRLTSSLEADFAGIAFADGSSLVYSTLRGRAPNLILRELATGREEHLQPRSTFQVATDVSVDGRLLAFLERGDSGKFHAWTLRLDGEPESLPERLFLSDSAQSHVRFSPDARFVAWLSDESGELEAYVAPLDSTLQAIRLSTKGARLLRWSSDGREIFLLTPARELQAVAVRTAPRLEVGATTTLFTLASGERWLDFDVSPDGRRFLANVLVRSGSAQPATVVLDWRPVAQP